MFAYDALMGENDLRDYGAQPAVLDGYHRAFNHTSTLLWGSPEHPCPTIGLSPGGECAGLAFEVRFSRRRAMKLRLRPAEGSEQFHKAKRRVQLADGSRVSATVWISKPEFHEGRWTSAELVPERFTAALGTAGRGVEYVRTIAHALQLWGLSDPTIEHLWSQMEAWRPR